MTNFKKGDRVFVKKGKHLTEGCEDFHKQMEYWKEIEYEFELTDPFRYRGQNCWWVNDGTGYVIVESDLELVNFNLENE